MYDGLTLRIGLTARLSGAGTVLIPKRDFTSRQPTSIPSGGHIDLFNARIDPLFPVLYKNYFNQPVGEVTLKNRGKETLTDVEVRLVLSQYMDNPELSASLDELIPGEEKTVDLYIFFNYTVLSITEGAKLAGELRADYFMEGYPASDALTVVVDTYDRNALRWDDDEKIASFITARDEEIMGYSRNAASETRDALLPGFNREFQQAMALFTAMQVSGCTYVVDPSSSYSSLSEDAVSVDAVQFPRQTLQYRAGDCDDLTAAYTTLLESVGVETGFITVPGHIYSAFRLKLTPSEAMKTFSGADMIITDDRNRVWIPVETTALEKGFLKAWELGARQWYQHIREDRARLYPTSAAWEKYQPVAFKVSDAKLAPLETERLTASFSRELNAFVDREISLRGGLLLTRLEKYPGHPKVLNSLGVLYARYNRDEKASEYFEQAASGSEPYAPALVNLGNMSYLREDYYDAGSYYQQARDIQKNSPAALLGLARVSYALNDLSGAKGRYKELEALSPELAARYAYLGDESSVTRASGAGVIGAAVAWDEEE